MPREPRDPRSESDKAIDSIIESACVRLFRQIDDLPEDRTLPQSRSDLWVSAYKDDLCKMIRSRLISSIIVLDREIIRVWLAIRKNPQFHGVPKREKACDARID